MISLGVGVGSAVAFYNVFLKPVPGLSGQSRAARIMGPGKLTDKIEAAMITVKPNLTNEVIIPIGVGMVVTATGKFVGANKYMHKVPVIGKKVNF